MENKMKDLLSRVSLPGKIFDLLWTDDEFYRELSGNKKVSSSGKFPRCDQWCDQDGFHMAFALAGYSPSDVSVSIRGNMLSIDGSGLKMEKEDEYVGVINNDDYPAKNPSPGVQQGMIVRGIARRTFRTKYFINPSFNLSGAQASMKDGLLEIFIPKGEEVEFTHIKIKEN